MEMVTYTKKVHKIKYYDFKIFHKPALRKYVALSLKNHSFSIYLSECS